MLARVLLAAVALLAARPANSYALTIVTRGEATQAAVADAYVRPIHRGDRNPGATGDLGRQHGNCCAPRRPRAAGTSWRSTPTNWPPVAATELFEKLDWSAIGGKDHYLSMGVSDCGVGADLAQHRPRLGPRQVSGRRPPGPISGTWRKFPASAGWRKKRARRAGVRVDGRRGRSG